MKILVVDDEQMLASVLGRALSRLGHVAHIVVDPQDAIALIASPESDFDAVITDIDMPRMSGVELARVVRARHPEIPIAFCTGSDPDSSNVRAAGLLGRVYGKVRSVGEARDIIDCFGAPLELARGSQTTMKRPYPTDWMCDD